MSRHELQTGEQITDMLSNMSDEKGIDYINTLNSFERVELFQHHKKVFDDDHVAFNMSSRQIHAKLKNQGVI